MARIPIGLELWSVRNEFAKDPLGTLKAVAAMGYEGVEFAGEPAVSGALLRAMLDETRLACCGWHTPVEMLFDDRLAATIELNKVVGNRRLIVPGLPKNMSGNKAKWLQTAGFFNSLADKLAPHDMVSGYHSHYEELVPVAGESPWEVFADNTDRRFIMHSIPAMRSCGGADPVAMLAKYPGRGGTVHLKPYTPSDGKADKFRGFDRPIGQDEVNGRAVFNVCEKSAGTEWYIVEYEVGPLPPLQGVELRLQGLKAMGR